MIDTTEFDKQEQTYRDQIEIVNKLWKAYEYFQHYSKFSKRVIPHIKKELPQNCFVVLNTSNYFNGISIHNIGKNNESLSISWSVGFGEEVPWQKKFTEELHRHDMSDQLERMKAERNLFALFQTTEEQIINLQKLAKQHIAQLPIPNSASLRSSSIYWNDATSECKQMFPNVFKDIK